MPPSQATINGHSDLVEKGHIVPIPNFFRQMSLLRIACKPFRILSACSLNGIWIEITHLGGFTDTRQTNRRPDRTRSPRVCVPSQDVRSEASCDFQLGCNDDRRRQPVQCLPPAPRRSPFVFRRCTRIHRSGSQCEEPIDYSATAPNPRCPVPSACEALNVVPTTL